MEGTPTILHDAVRAVPALALAMFGTLYAIRMLVNAYREETKERNAVIDRRHSEYFGELHDIVDKLDTLQRHTQAESVECIRENTRVLAGIEGVIRNHDELLRQIITKLQ